VAAAEETLSKLIAIYLEKREALVRFFTARLGSATAAEDLVQDIYLKLCNIEPDGDVQNEVGYLYRLGSNLMLDRLRQQRRAAARDNQWLQTNTVRLGGDEVADEPGADAVVTSRQRLGHMLSALEALPPSQRQAFRLHKLEGKSQVETAQILGCSVSSVEKYIRAAMKQLVERLA
jgi:RNA polymerase sigma factor (sigma-70 family)